MMLAYTSNQLTWLGDPDMMAWLDSARLNLLSHTTAALSERARQDHRHALAAAAAHQCQAGHSAAPASSCRRNAMPGQAVLSPVRCHQHAVGRMVLVVEPVVRRCGRGPVVLLIHFPFRM